jgi:hypothetical protein
MVLNGKLRRRKGNCWNNAAVEIFFKSLKTECVYQHKFNSRKEPKSAVFQWIEGWSNTNRIHSSLKNKSILEFNNNNNQTLAAQLHLVSGFIEQVHLRDCKLKSVDESRIPLQGLSEKN